MEDSVQEDAPAARRFHFLARPLVWIHGGHVDFVAGHFLQRSGQFSIRLGGKELPHTTRNVI